MDKDIIKPSQTCLLSKFMRHLVRQKHKWTEEERLIVRRDYLHTSLSAQTIGHKLGVTGNAVKGQVQSMGLSRISRRPWLPEEDELLGDLISRLAPSTVARRLHRSINSVVIRTRRLGFSRRVRNGWYTKNDVCEILGVDHHWIQRHIDSGILKANWHNDSKPQKNGAACWHISEVALKEFLRKYPSELTGRNVDLFAIVDILVGIVPSDK